MTLADFFCGAGLIREALSDWACVYATDISPVKARMYEARFPDTSVHLADIRQVDEVVDCIPGGVVLAAGGFPCTDVSSGGKRAGLSGPRSSAWYGFAAVLERLGDRRPPLLLIENVPGLYLHHPDDFREVVLTLHRLGYRMDVFVLHATDFVPQSRSRLFIVGVLGGLPAPPIEIPVWWERRVRPVPLVLLMNDLRLPWLRLAPPPPPPRRDALADVVDLDAGDWWPAERAGRYLARATGPTRATLDRLRTDGGLHVVTLAWKAKGWGSSFNGLAQCLMPPRHGSQYRLLVVVEAGRLRMRELSPVEYGLLMGSAGDWSSFKPNHARLGLADGVVVPVVRWIDRHVLRPLAAGIDGRSTPTGTPGCPSSPPYRA